MNAQNTPVRSTGMLAPVLPSEFNTLLNDRAHRARSYRDAVIWWSNQAHFDYRMALHPYVIDAAAWQRAGDQCASRAEYWRSMLIAEIHRNT
jgi:hypothetical protein